MRRALLLAAPALALTARNLSAPIERIVGRVPDDALFYLVIARRLHAGEGFTFDGVAPTTGFHPAWLAIVTALVPTADPLVGFRVLLALHGAVTVVSVLLLDGILARAGVGPWRRGLGAAAAGAWAASAYGLGMETALVAALGLAAVALGMAGEGAPGQAAFGSDLPPPCGGTWPKVGWGLSSPGSTPSLRASSGQRTLAFLLGFSLALTRMDAVPLLLGAGRRAPAALAGGVAGVFATGAFNYAVTGEWASTAAALKGLGSVGERLARLDPAGVWRHVPGPAVAALVVLVVVRIVGLARRSGPRPMPAPIALAVLGSALWIGASYLLNNLVGPWYLLPPTWILLAAAIVATTRASERVGAALITGLALALLRGAGLPAPGLHATVLAFARDVAATTPLDAAVIAEDFPGMLAWFGERTVLPADGLAASPGYRSALTTGAAFAWWKERGATHYAVTRRRAPWPHDPDGSPLVDAIAPPFLPVPPSRVPLEAEHRLVERVDPGSGRLFALYRIEGG